MIIIQKIKIHNSKTDKPKNICTHIRLIMPKIQKIDSENINIPPKGFKSLMPKKGKTIVKKIYILNIKINIAHKINTLCKKRTVDVSGSINY